jgi:hypothetical protein
MDKEHIDKCPGCSSQLFGPVAYCPFCGKQMVTDTSSTPPIINGPNIKGLAITDADNAAITVMAIAEGCEGLVVERAEYWIGDDPGPGKGNPMKAVSGSFKSSQEDITITINIDSFKPGDCLIHVRSADIRGIWGEPQTVSFMKVRSHEPPKPGPTIINLTVKYTDEKTVSVTATAISEEGGNIANAEYWIGDDPGPGKGKHMNGAFGSPRVDISISIDVSEYKPGKNTVQVRCADAKGTWGKPQKAILTIKRKNILRNIAIIIGFVSLIAVLIFFSRNLFFYDANKMAKLSVSSTPNGATLSIDKIDKGITPKTDISVNSGTHHLVLQKQGYLTSEQDIVIKSGENRTLVVNLTKTSTPPEEKTVLPPEKPATLPEKPTPVAIPSTSNNTGREISSYLAEGKQHYSEGKYERCIDKMEEVLKRDPNNQEAIQYKKMAKDKLDAIDREFKNPEVGRSR